MKRIALLLTATAVVLAGIAFLVLHLHQADEDELVSRFQDHQLLLARQLADQIELYLDTHPQDLRSSSVPGAVSLSADLAHLLARQLALATSEREPHQLWVMDRDRTLLLHTAHPEMTGRNLRQKGQECLQCHPSFDHVEQMLAQGQGAVEYQLKDQLRKLAAFAPVDAGQAAWIVAVTTPLDWVTGFNQNEMLKIYLLLGVFAVGLGLAAGLGYREYHLKVKARAEARQWQEKRALEDRIRASEERYRQLIELLPDAVVIYCEGKIVFVNQAGAELMGAASPDALIGKPVRDFVLPERWEFIAALLRQVIEERGRTPLVEEQLIRLDGSVTEVEVRGLPFTYQNRPAAQFVLRDITGRKRAEEELRRRVAELERFNRLAVGRELKMKELKERLRQLEAGQPGAAGNARP